MDATTTATAASPAAIVAPSASAADLLLLGFAREMLQAGYRLGGLLRSPTADAADDGGSAARVIDLLTGRDLSLCRLLGHRPTPCTLYPPGIAAAALAISRAIVEDVDLLIIERFGIKEAAGGGLNAEIADAITARLPVLTAVDPDHLDAWIAFTAGRGPLLPCDPEALRTWWRDIARTIGRARTVARLDPALRDAPEGAATGRQEVIPPRL